MLTVYEKTSKPSLLRKLLLMIAVGIFIYLTSIFAYQYRKDQKDDYSLDDKYREVARLMAPIENLSSTFQQANNFFQQYALDFDIKSYELYVQKLEEMRLSIDSVVPSLSSGKGATFLESKHIRQMEFSQLRKAVADLIFLSQDSLTILNESSPLRIKTSKPLSTEYMISKILADSSLNTVSSDTTVHQKQNLFKRIFKAKDNLVVENSYLQSFTNTQIEAMHRNIDQFSNIQSSLQQADIKKLRQKYSSLLRKEREIIHSNQRLLSALRTSIEKIRNDQSSNFDQLRDSDLSSEKQTVKVFKMQLAMALAVMLLLIVLLVIYQSSVTNYEKKLRKEKEYAKALAEEKTNILANVSHEVRTPISSLAGVVEILSRDKEKHSISEDYLSMVSHEIRVINNTLNDILSLGKLEVGKLEVKNEFVPIHGALSDLVGLHRYQAEKKGLKLYYNPEFGEDLEINTSAFQLRQIISNLLGNAIKYTSQGEISLSSKLIEKQGNQVLSIAVKDSGRGISKENQDEIFKQYYMADPKAKTGGVGLGLYISNLLAKQLKGKLRVESQLGHGAKFILTLPAPSTRLIKKKGIRYSISDLPADVKLAFIDDNIINIKYLEHFLGGHNSSYFFQDPQQALKFIEESPINILVTDMLMPGTSGWEILKYIRESEKMGHVSVFLFSAEADYNHTDPISQKHNFDAVLSKPLDEHDFVAQVLKITWQKNRLN